MLVTKEEIQNNFGYYLKLVKKKEIVIIENDRPIARLLNVEAPLADLSDQLVGILPENIDEKALKHERLCKK